MGTDMRAVIEIHTGNYWEVLERLDINRDYLLFDLIAGVRGELAPVYIRDFVFPDDVSMVSQILFNRSNGGQQGCLTLDELRDVQYQFEARGERSNNYKDTSLKLKTIIETMTLYQEDLNWETRLIYWFIDGGYYFYPDIPDGRNSEYEEMPE